MKYPIALPLVLSILFCSAFSRVTLAYDLDLGTKSDPIVGKKLCLIRDDLATDSQGNLTLIKAGTCGEVIDYQIKRDTLPPYDILLDYIEVFQIQIQQAQFEFIQHSNDFNWPTSRRASEDMPSHAKRFYLFDGLDGKKNFEQKRYFQLELYDQTVSRLANNFLVSANCFIQDLEEPSNTWSLGDTKYPYSLYMSSGFTFRKPWIGRNIVLKYWVSVNAKMNFEIYFKVFQYEFMLPGGGNSGLGDNVMAFVHTPLVENAEFSFPVGWWGIGNDIRFKCTSKLN